MVMLLRAIDPEHHRDLWEEAGLLLSGVELAGAKDHAVVTCGPLIQCSGRYQRANAALLVRDAIAQRLPGASGTATLKINPDTRAGLTCLQVEHMDAQWVRLGSLRWQGESGQAADA